MEWTREKTICLINMYRSRTVLWDCREKNYKDRNKRHNALMEIAISFRESKREIERKIKNLQSHFTRELRKERVSDMDKPYKSKWFAYQSMVFLVEKNKPRKMVSEDLHVSKNEEEDKDKEDEIIIIAQSPETATNELSENIQQRQTNAGSKRKFLFPNKCSVPIRTRKSGKPLVNQTYTTMPEMYAEKCERDEFTVFGEQVAIKLRKLPTAHAKIIVQHLINTTLFEGALGNYNDPTINPFGSSGRNTAFSSPTSYSSH